MMRIIYTENSPFVNFHYDISTQVKLYADVLSIDSTTQPMQLFNMKHKERNIYNNIDDDDSMV